MRFISIALLFVILAGTALPDGTPLPCNTSSADHPVLTEETIMIIDSFDTFEEAEAEFHDLTAPGNAAAQAQLFSDILHDYIADNFYTGVSCGPCPYPDACVKEVRLLEYGPIAKQTAVIANESGGSDLVFIMKQSLELKMRCTECRFRFGH